MKCRDIIKKYLSSLESNFITEPTDIGCHIITPFMGFNGEPIHFYIEENPGYLRITDAGNTILQLKTMDIDINSGKEKELYDEILRLYSIGELDGEIMIDSSIDELPNKLIFYINALQSIFDLEFLIAPSRIKTFSQIVREYCDVNDLKYRYLNKINIGLHEHPIDIMSIDLKNLIQTLGTIVEMPRKMKSFTELKLFPFVELELPKHSKIKKNFYRVVIFDETVEWDDQTISMMEEFSDYHITWKDAKKEKKLESLLTV